MATPRRYAITAALTAIPLVTSLGTMAAGTATASPAPQLAGRAASAASAASVTADGEDLAALGDPQGPVPVQVDGPTVPSAAALVTRAGRFSQSQGAAAMAITMAGAARAARVPVPTVSLPPTLDVRPPYAGQTSCDPYAKPGTRAYAELMRQTFGIGGYGIERTCTAGGTSEHKEGRAVDWMLNAADPAQKAVADAATAWLTENEGANARRLGVLYIIWNRKMWRAYAPERGWTPYVGDSPHTDHIHTSLTWDGAMGRTSWWTGSAIGRGDLGPCRVYRGQFAPLYTGPQYQRCSTALPAAPYSPFPVYVVGQKAANIAVAQRALGVNADGAFGSATRNALLSWQASNGVPRTGVLDKPTWARLVPKPPPANPTTPSDTGTPANTTVPATPYEPYQPDQATGPSSGAPGSNPAAIAALPPAPARILPLPQAVTTRFTAIKGLVLRPGAKGAPVRTLQRALGMRADGVFTASTARAVRNVQRAYRLPMTGLTDRKTWNRIELKTFPWLGYGKTALAQGSRGPAVVALQRALRVGADGEFGPVTARAVLIVQQRYGLAPDGIVRGATWRAVSAQAPR